MRTVRQKAHNKFGSHLLTCNFIGDLRSTTSIRHKGARLTAYTKVITRGSSFKKLVLSTTEPSNS